MYPNNDNEMCKTILYRGFEKLEVGVALLDKEAEFQYAREGFGFTRDFIIFTTVCLFATVVMVLMKCRQVACCLCCCCPVADEDAEPKDASVK